MNTPSDNSHAAAAPSPTRTEQDALGTQTLPAEALHGIHTARAVTNFPLAQRPVNAALVHAYGAVKLAAAQTNHALGHWDAPTFAAIERACREMMGGQLDAHILVDALQGGAGTSTNMNVNEVLTNRALQLLDRHPGDDSTLSPLDDLNLHQSTNDTYPTALHVAAIQELRTLEQALVGLLEAFQRQEQALAHVVKVGRTQFQDAVLTTLGRSMGGYAEAFGRDRWRVYKCEERLRVVNLGGTAIGSGLSAPRDYIFRVVDQLKGITGIGLARSENLVDATQNHDALVEVSGILSACAATLLKCSGDLRLMGSGPDAGLGELNLPARQAGSSAMPGKVNPVIPEAVTQAAMRVAANHALILQACAAGSLELNPFLPVVADALLESIQLLGRACQLLQTHCIDGLTANEARCAATVAGATATATALVERLGYAAVEALVAEARANATTVRDLVIERKLLTPDEYAACISPENVMKLGTRKI